MHFKRKRTHSFFILSFALLLGVKPAQARDTKATGEVKTGIASWYGPNFHGRKTANGEIFDQQKLTCASNHFPLGTWLKITNLRNGKSVVVKVNDRMSPKVHRVVDLSKAAGAIIGIDKTGIGKVQVENLGKYLSRK
jgi:rare lipoprotein A